MKKNKMTRDTIPENFTLELAMVDAIPVLFFGGSMVLAGILFRSILFLIGACLCLFAGAAKVLWKVIVVLRHKNIWWLFLQMRILMPVGMLMMLAGGIFASTQTDLHSLLDRALRMPAVLFFIAGILGMCLMTFFAFRLDSSDVKSNWIEQITNGVAQIAFFIGLLCLLV